MTNDIRSDGPWSRRPGKRLGQAGFTLLELLVVLAILGFLATIAAPPVFRYLSGAKVSTAQVQIKNLSSSLDLFRLDVGRYPTTQEGLAALIDAPAGVDKWNGPYLKVDGPLLDPWGHPYNYRFPGTKGEYDLTTSGPDAPSGDGG